jgi:hypothetical protein
MIDVPQGGSGNAQAKLEVSGPDGGAVQVQTEVTVIEARLLTPEQPHAFKSALLGLQAHGAGAAHHIRAELAPESIDDRSPDPNQRPKIIPHSRINSLIFPREALATRAARAES